MSAFCIKPKLIEHTEIPLYDENISIDYIRYNFIECIWSEAASHAALV